MKDATTRVEFRNTALPISVLVYPSQETPGWWIVKAMTEAPDRDTGKPGSFSVVYRFKRKRHPGRRRLAQWVRLTMRALLLHELDEVLHVDGVRVFDPHRGIKRS